MPDSTPNRRHGGLTDRRLFSSYGYEMRWYRFISGGRRGGKLKASQRPPRYRN